MFPFQTNQKQHHKGHTGHDLFRSRSIYFDLCNSILGKLSHVDKIFILQEKIMTIMFGSRPEASSKQLFVDTTVLTLHLHICCMYKIFQISTQDLLTIIISSYNKICQPLTKLPTGKQYNLYQRLKCFNKYLSYVREKAENNVKNFFQRNRNTFFIEKPLYSIEDFLQYNPIKANDLL